MPNAILETDARTNETSANHPQDNDSDFQQKEIGKAGPFDKAHLTWSRIDWPVLGWMLLVHAGCLAAPFYFSWTALAVAVGLHWLTCSIGVCLGYHRNLSHASFRLPAPVRFCTTLCGVLSGEGSPLTWAATHRVHHARSDKKGDPHSPRDGVFWSHILWIFVRRNREEVAELHRRFAPDLVKDPILQFFEKTYGLWLVGFAALLYAVGGMPMLIWGVCVRLTVAYHTTWLINSASHLWGYRTYETTDDSRNLWWAGLLAYGEGWHNNHHAWPRVACYGHRWWEFDITWQAIKALRFLGLASDVDDRIPSRDTTTAELPRYADRN
ncbi:MAG: fatty acid desaturase [Rhodopirellula sp.]|nr:fatty acid desaturase [Rhodopirellula sp.]